jgi:tetratricopeptide (TPR) repeat protein
MANASTVPGDSLSDEERAEVAAHLRTILIPLRQADVSTAIAAAQDVERWIGTLADPLIRARLLFQVGELFVDAGAGDQARPYYEHALALGPSLTGVPAHRNAGLCLARLGALERDAGHLDDAIASFAQAAEHLVAAGDDRKAGAAWNSLGLIYQHQRRWDDAESCFRQAGALFERAQDVRSHAVSQGNLGKLALDRYRLAEAERLLEEAVTLTRAVDDPSLLTSHVGDLGNVLRAQGKSQEAARCYEEALRLAEQRGDDRGRSLSLGNLGALYWERRDLSRALMFLERSLEISAKLDDAEAHVRDLLHLALVCWGLDETDRGDRALQDALTLAETAAPGVLPEVLAHLGRAAEREGRLEEAESFYRRCLDLEVEEDEEYILASSWLDLGNIAWRRGRAAEAVDHWRQALTLARAAGNRVTASTASINLAAGFLAQGDVESAETHLRAALAVAESVPLPEDMRWAWEGLARCRWRRRDLAGARAASEEAASWGEKIRLETVGQAHRIAASRALEITYLDLVLLNWGLGDRRGAWAAGERGRSRALTELLGGSRLPTPDQVPEALREEEERLLARSRYLEAQALASPPAEVLAGLMEIGNAREALLERMSAVAPEHVALRRGEPPSYSGLRVLLVSPPSEASAP